MKEIKCKTAILENEIECCEDLRDFRKLVAENTANFVEWRSKISTLMMERGLTIPAVVEGCAVSKSAAKRFKRAIPSKRVNVIKLACMLHLSVEETDELLTRYAKVQRLYPKNSDDFIWIYILNQGGTDRPAALFEEYNEVFAEVCNSDLPAPPPSTGQVREKLLSAKDEWEFKNAVSFAAPAFRAGNQKLLEQIDGLFAACGADANALFSDDPYFKNLHRRTMKALRERRVCPSREYLVSLGLKLGLETPELNQLLEKAEMGPLCAKDRLDSAVYFFIEYMAVNCPAYFEKTNEDAVLRNDSRLLNMSACDTGYREEDLAFFIYNALEQSQLTFDEKSFRRLAKTLSGNLKEETE